MTTCMVQGVVKQLEEQEGAVGGGRLPSEAQPGIARESRKYFYE